MKKALKRFALILVIGGAGYGIYWYVTSGNTETEPKTEQADTTATAPADTAKKAVAADTTKNDTAAKK